MQHAPRTRLAALVAALALGLTVTGCGGDQPQEGDHSMAAPDQSKLATGTAGDLELSGGFVYATAPMEGMDSTDGAGSDMTDMTMVTAAFGTLSNGGDAEDALVGVATELTETAQIHETVANEDGTGGTMREVAQIVIPAGGRVALEPGGYHIMLMNLTGDVAAGTTVTLTLEFRSGTTMTVDFPVIDREDRPQS